MTAEIITFPITNKISINFDNIFFASVKTSQYQQANDNYGKFL